MSKKRYRIRFFFWLNMNNPDEEALADTIELLKNNRTFVTTIRDGIRLICDLRAGRTDSLFQLFPWVKDAGQVTPAITSEQRLQEQIARLEKLLLAQGNVPIQPQLIAAISETSSRHPGKPLVEITSSTGKANAAAVANNFLNSMKGMASGFFD